MGEGAGLGQCDRGRADDFGRIGAGEEVKDRVTTGNHVELISFNGKLNAPTSVPREDNYWLLIGSTGTVVEEIPKVGIKKDRVLIQFDVSVDQLGLACHNEIPNSLWIKRSDLSVC